MANNRAYIVCDICEDGSFDTALYIGKRLGGGYYQNKAPSELDWEQFYDTHEWCGAPEKTLDHFSIRYECKPDKEV